MGKLLQINAVSVCVTVLEHVEMDHSFYLGLKIVLFNNWPYTEAQLPIK